jgi:benzoyl-CoA reductase/2-hydroxyglutaryl-CoA dehydratase subunit BcrC/BadD/HgdB
MKKLFIIALLALTLKADTLSNAQELILKSQNLLQMQTLNLSKLNEFEKELNELANSPIDDENIEEILNAYLKLAQLSFELSYKITELTDKNSQTMSKDYIQTLLILTQTTLRLSDDIGKMADRIGEMADRIGTMADRIVYTEELIVKFSQMLNETAKYLINKIKLK